MSDERPTVRPVTLARLVETANLCGPVPMTTEAVETELDVSHRRARSTILEACRIGMLEEVKDDWYSSTAAGDAFVDAVQAEDWTRVSELLKTRSPHFGAFVSAVASVEPAPLDEVLSRLEEEAASTPYTYNQTSIEVLGDWGERLGTVQRNAFSGEYYVPQQDSLPGRFDRILLEVYDDLEETAGTGLRQRYLSIPELREECCSRVGATRGTFDDALRDLAQQNVGKLELSGAPLDTGAKDARYGIKEISLSDEDGLVSTSQSTEKVMAGIEQFGKQYYYLTVHDRDLTHTDQ